jgi:hypothetical protein
MKFAQNLPHNQVPEWASSAKNETRAGEDADLASTVRRVSLLARKT